MKTNNRAGRFKRNAEQEQGCGKEYSTEMLNELKCIPHAHHSSNATMPTVRWGRGVIPKSWGFDDSLLYELV
ncbi:unnamed protein product [Onchocerca ochengi]|uniref:Uncharacterized protein n=1 Tax=Onchocerca ochengi TaxID=42157 RepID=A0A182DWR8_ONCOC|nr:unnamed protein product [Onchocerca ochengi]